MTRGAVRPDSGTAWQQCFSSNRTAAVSYTHLDVYKRQTFDSSVVTSSVATEIEDAVDYVVNLYDSSFSNPITINIDVGWGEVDGQALESNALGESISNTSCLLYTSRCV